MTRCAGVNSLSVCLTGVYPPHGVDAIIGPRGVGQHRHTGQGSRHSGERPLPAVLPSAVGRGVGPTGPTLGGCGGWRPRLGFPPNRRLPGPPADVAWRLPCSAELVKGVGATMPKGLRITPKGLTAEGDRVAVEAESYGETASGKIYNNLYHFLFEVRDGKIQAVREYLDTLHTKDVFVDQ